jgi:Tol biopolymer transport system component
VDATINLVSDLRQYDHSGIDWSPDGTQVAMVHRIDREIEVTLIEIDSGAADAIVVGESPAWSPEGDRIAFVRDGELYVTALGPGTESKLFDVAQPFVGGPRWSSDGESISFLYSPGRLSPISIADSMAGEPRHVAYGTEPVWSPDGSRVAFLGYSFGGLSGVYDIYVMTSEGTGIREVGRGTYTDIVSCWTHSIAWSGDGDRVLYWDGGRGMMSVPADGSEAPTTVDEPCRDRERPPPDYEPPSMIPSPEGDKVLILD